MSIELITGFTGAPHIDSLEASKFNAAIVGRGDYVLEGVGDKMLKATMVTANKVHIDPGNGLMQGRHYVVDAAGVDLVVQTGTQGQKRSDLVVARYTKNATTGVEGVALVVLKGTPVASSPSDPVHTKGDILNGSALVADMPLWRIPLDGITVGAPVRLFDIYKSGADACDYITRTKMGIWDVVKRPDGVSICTARISLSLDLSISYTNNVMFGQIQPYAYPPGLFSKPPNVQVFVEPGDHTMWLASHNPGTAQATPPLRMLTYNQCTVPVVINIRAEG